MRVCGKFLIQYNFVKLSMLLAMQATVEASTGASDASLDGYSGSVTKATKQRRDPAMEASQTGRRS